MWWVCGGGWGVAVWWVGVLGVHHYTIRRLVEMEVEVEVGLEV